MSDDNNQMLIGELAQRVGVTVRTLQYYDRIGLLPAKSTEGGRRAYTGEHIIRLQRILFLKSLGFSLDDIRNYLSDSSSTANLTKIFTQQREILQHQMERMAEAVRQLDAVIEELESGQEMNFQRIVALMELMKQNNPYDFALKYIKDEQFARLSQRFENSAGADEFMKQANELIAQAQDLYLRRASPSGPEGQAIAGRWWHQIESLTQGDEELLKSLVSVGTNLENWPERAANIQQVMKDFLGPALVIYLESIGIHIAEAGERADE